MFYSFYPPGEDPETRRMRTVKNIADLRQNLEETMSSLRGTQISHRWVFDRWEKIVQRQISRPVGAGLTVI